MKTKVAIIGAGPAGLTAGYLLSKEAVDVVVLEADPVYVGGISRTVTYKGFHFDIGGHRFFSKSRGLEVFWTEVLPTGPRNGSEDFRSAARSRTRSFHSSTTAIAPKSSRPLSIRFVTRGAVPA